MVLNFDLGNVNQVYLHLTAYYYRGIVVIFRLAGDTSHISKAFSLH